MVDDGSKSVKVVIDPTIKPTQKLQEKFSEKKYHTEKTEEKYYTEKTEEKSHVQPVTLKPGVGILSGKLAVITGSSRGLGKVRVFLVLFSTQSFCYATLSVSFSFFFFLFLSSSSPLLLLLLLSPSPSRSSTHPFPRKLPNNFVLLEPTSQFTELPKIALLIWVKELL
jgi:hypothetical protein